MDKPFFNAFTKDGMGIKGLGDGDHLSHNPASEEFHLTSPIRIDDLGTLKIHDRFDTLGNYKSSDFGFTTKE